MKKKILLFSLFSITIVIALIGLSTEKTRASIWDDKSPWMEMAESTGQERSETVKCSKTVTIIPSDPYKPGTTFPTEEWYATAISCEHSYVVMSPCTPYNPCY